MKSKIERKNNLSSEGNETEVINKKKQKHLKHKLKNEDSGNSVSTSNKKIKKSIQFQETVEVNIEGSIETRKLNEEAPDTTPIITKMISKMNSYKAGKKKLKTKKEMKLQKQIEDSKLVQQQSIDYLRKWKNNKADWKFEKAKQNRLINYMFDSTKLPDDVFPIFIEYITGSKGNITNVLSQKCSVVVKEMEDFKELDEEEQDKKTKPDEIKYERARSILQAV